jgi:hypothetical protein
MKNIILTISFCSIFLLNGNGQIDTSKFKINRCYLNMGAMIPRHFQVGFYFHFNDHFMFALNRLTSSHLVAYNLYAFPYPASKLYDDFTSTNLLIGVTSNNYKRFNADFLLGFSEMKGEINNEIYVYQNPTMQSDQKLMSKVEYFSNYGFATRLDLNFNLFPYFGLNLAAQNVYTSRHNQLNISVGLNIGLVQNKGKFKNKKIVKQSQRKPVL